MLSYDIFFFAALFFLVGVLFASFGAGIWILVLTLAAAAAFLIFAFLKKRKSTCFFWLAGLLIFVLFGAVYYTWDDLNLEESVNIHFDDPDAPVGAGKITFSGVVVSNPVFKSSSQEFKLVLDSPFSGNVLVKTDRYPEFSYGDEVEVRGKIEKPFSESYGKYLAKERISGVSTFAEVDKLGSGKAGGVKEFLFGVKNGMTESFQKVLPPKESALLSGLTLGERGEFSEDFKEAMSKSGTTHLVALSGYNISIIVWTLMGIFVWFSVRKRAAFFFTVLVIIGFVLMTGAEASVVRAAIMGILVMLAHEMGRFFDFRNAIILAGLVMVLQNPKVLAYDIGFQLSFLALLGIIYLRPAIIKFMHLGEEPGILSWRENLLTTASAQLMVAPLLIANFGNFSPISLVANVLVLELIPVTMALGFVIAILSFFSYYLPLFLGLVASVLLKFEILVIEFFAKISIPFSPNAGIFSSVAYYALITGFIVYASRKRQ